MQFDKIAVAESALAKLGPEAARLATYYELKARIAAAKKDSLNAEKNFAEAAKLDPSNKSYQFSLAIYQLQSSSPEIRLGASKLLQHLMEDKDFRVPAARALRDRVVARLCEIKADDEKAKNDFSQLSLLLNLNLKHAHEAAEQLYRKDSKNALFASTYAFSLYRRGRYQEAAKVMADLKPEELEKPGLAAYYGVFLAATGDKSRAAEVPEKRFGGFFASRGETSSPKCPEQG